MCRALRAFVSTFDGQDSSMPASLSPFCLAYSAIARCPRSRTLDMYDIDYYLGIIGRSVGLFV